MSINNGLKLCLVIGVTIIGACSNGDEVTVPKVAECLEVSKLLELSEPIPAQIKQVEANQPFYKGIKIYYEVDAEIYLPELFKKNKEKLIRIFPVDGLVAKIGETTSIKGELSSCLTGDHGLLTNDFKLFYILSTE